MHEASRVGFKSERGGPYRDNIVDVYNEYKARVQYLSVPELLEASEVPYETKDRGDTLDYPLILMGGCQSFNSTPIDDFLDAVIVGEGEQSLTSFMKLLREYKAAGGNSREEFLAKATKEIQGVYVPRFYEYTYYPPDHDKKPNQIKEFHRTEQGIKYDVPEIVTKSYNDFVNQKILTKTFVGKRPHCRRKIS